MVRHTVVALVSLQILGCHFNIHQRNIGIFPRMTTVLCNLLKATIKDLQRLLDEKKCDSVDLIEACLVGRHVVMSDVPRLRQGIGL